MAASGWNRSREKDPSSTSRSQAEDSPERQQILVVEDNPPDVFLIREAIATAGISAEIYVVHDGHEATRFFDAADADDQAPCPDIVLLDLNLPKKNGDEVLRHLRSSRTCCKATVLIITSSDSQQDRQSTKELGAQGYFRKPSDYEEFMRLGPIVKDLLGRVRDDSGS